MRYSDLRPILRTDQFEETITFYTKLLGFTLGGKSEDWASLHKDEVEIMVSKPNQHTPFAKPAFTGSLYFTIDDVDGLWKKLKGKVDICYEPEDFEWQMREFAIYDINGYTLQFGQPMTKE